MAYTLAGVEQFVSLGSASVTSGGEDAPAAGTSENWTLSSSSLPAASSSAYTGFYVADPANSSEVILVTNISGSTATVTRGADGTTPVTHSNPFTILQVGAGASLRALQAGQYVFNVVTQFGADPTGVNASDTAFGDAIAARPTDGCMLVVPPGTYSITAGVTWELGASEVSALQFMPGCVVSYSGTGDCFRIYSAQPADSDLCQFKIYGCPVIDGTSAGAGSSGIHMGDIFRLTLEDALIRNFNGTGSVGLWLDNTSAQTEQGKIRCYTQDCATGVKLDVNSGSASGNGTTSYDRTQLDLGVTNSNATFDGVVFNNGALLLEGKLQLSGNFGGSDSALTSAVLRLTGDFNGSYSQIISSELQIGVEVGAGTNQPYTIYFGADDNEITDCYGTIQFGSSDALFQQSNCTANFRSYSGNVSGDPALPSSVPFPVTNLAHGQGTISSATATDLTSVYIPIGAYVANYVRALVPFTGANSSGSVTFALSGPTIVPTTSAITTKVWSGTSVVEQTIAGTTSALVTSLANTTTRQLLDVEGVIQCNSSGTLYVTGAVSSPGTVLIGYGSLFSVQQISDP